MQFNFQTITSAHMAHKVIKHSSENEPIVLLLKRIPHAVVQAVTRTEQKQDIGLVCQGSVNEVNMGWIVQRHSQ